MNREFLEQFTLDPEIVFLNHGSFGACPRAVLEAQSQWRARMERHPVLFHARELEGELDNARDALARFVHAESDDLVFVPNATAGVNAVLRSMDLKPGDEIIVTNHEYNACANVARFIAERAGANVVVVDIPLPIHTEDEVVEKMVGAVTDRTRIALVDHITSQTALVLPIKQIVSALADRGVETLVDGAHAPGMVDLDVPSIGAAYYTANCHKWICAPKGSAFLWVRRDRQESVRPAIISHGANTERADRSRFLVEFDWTGTIDPTAYLTVPTAIDTMGRMLPGGWPQLREQNRQLAINSRRTLLDALGGEPQCPESMLGSIATVRIPDGEAGPAHSPLYNDPLQARLYDEHRIEVPIVGWPAPPKRLLRISAQVYNEMADYEMLAGALAAFLAAQPA